MLAKDFNFNRFLKIKEEKDKKYLEFLRGEKWDVPVVQRPVFKHFGVLGNSKATSLESQLDSLTTSLDLKSDFLFPYLEPWHGVGVYANAFGCPVIWNDFDASQTHAIYFNEEDIAHFKKPDIKNCELMNMVLDTIRYFREQTGDQIDISMTDTQSPNDTASLIIDTCEFFVLSLTEPELLQPFMQSVTDTMIQFSEMQMEAMGPTRTSPGHLMLSSRDFKGIAISDDNMAVISPDSYENTALPYNRQLSRHFGGLAVHTCGNFAHNAKLLLQTENLMMMDCALGNFVDPQPNVPADLKKLFAGTDTVLKVRLGANQFDLLEDLIDRNLKLIVQISSNGTLEERNCEYEAAKEKVAEIMSRKG